jgi:NAD-dependent dihydropyrimidine dehydrogenase PreA subunit
MAKILKVLLPEKCNGCELCLIETQKQLGKVGLDGSLIRILRSINSSTSAVEFQIELDPQVNSLDIKKIMQICPRGVFSLEEG